MEDDDFIFREVDEAVRAERARQFWQRFGGIIVAGCLTLVGSIIGYEWWQSHRTGQNEKATDQLLIGHGLLEKNQFESAAQRFDAVTSGEQELRHIAMLYEATSLKEAGKNAEAEALFKQVQDASGNEALKNYAALQRDASEAIAKPEQAFGIFALEREALKQWGAGNATQAKALLEIALKQPALPATQRARLEELLELVSRGK